MVLCFLTTKNDYDDDKEGGNMDGDTSVYFKDQAGRPMFNQSGTVIGVQMFGTTRMTSMLIDVCFSYL